MKKIIHLEYILALLFCLLITFFIIPPNKTRLYPKLSSFQILDRHGRLLREVLSRDYKTSTWVAIDEISPYLIEATILREDKRFYFHRGIDGLALVRALYENFKNKKIVSGGSTITMQIAKMALNIKSRNILTKTAEVLYALKLELHLNKKELLEIYLNRAPYGNQTYGVEAATNFYYKKKARDLSLSESCILAIIPQSPTRLNPYLNPGLVLQEKNRLLRSLVVKKWIDSLDFANARNESMSIIPAGFNFEAPHFVDYILTELDKLKIVNTPRVITSIDLQLQKDLEKLLLTTLQSLEIHNVNQGAVLVMDTQTGEILAMIGSKDYFDAQEGQVNGCLALRQPGSSIKPFVYIAALESGTPASYLLPDTIVEFLLSDGTKFAPRNYGDRYHGPTRAREALASSFNVPTVYLLAQIGVQRFHNLLKELNFVNLKKETDFYGLSLGLGAAEVSLLEIINAYRAIAKGGVWEEPRLILSPEKSTEKMAKKVFSPDIAYIITDILSDNASRIKAFGEDSPLNLPFPCAAKTGTTKDFRDNWCIGFTEKYVVGVWVGNFTGAPMEGVSGISGAAPLFRDVMIDLHKKEYPRVFEEPSGLVHLKICAKSGLMANKRCDKVIEEIFIPGTEPKVLCGGCEHEDIYARDLNSTMPNPEKRIKILIPALGDIYKIDPQVSYSSQGIIFQVRADSEINEVVFKLNGKTLCRKRYPFKHLWKPKPGEYKLEAIAQDRTGQETDFSIFRVY